MKIDMLMPQMGESITEATISKWTKSVGDKVAEGEIILEISTDKVDSEIPAPESGVIIEILHTQGAVVPVKELIAIIDTEAEATNTSKSENNVIDITPTQTEKSNTDQNNDQTSSRYYSPLVKSLAIKHNISLSELDSVPGTGQRDRFTKTDFLNYIDKNNSSSSKQSAKKEEIKTNTAVKSETKTISKDSSPVSIPKNAELIPMSNMRKAVAEHMVRSKQTSPHVYSIQEVDVSSVAKWRAMYKAEFKKKEGFNLSFTSFFLEATIKALTKFPNVNASVDGNTIIVKKDINLGCAVALGNTGLIVPVIKNADEKNLVGIARSLYDIADRARNKKLLPDDVSGGTFTVTNPGVFGTLIGTPIINQPQAAILCLGAIEKRPVVVNDMIAIRERCYLTISYDHRIIDGSLGGSFLKYIKDYLENWDMDRPLY